MKHVLQQVTNLSSQKREGKEETWKELASYWSIYLFVTLWLLAAHNSNETRWTLCYKHSKSTNSNSSISVVHLSTYYIMASTLEMNLSLKFLLDLWGIVPWKKRIPIYLTSLLRQLLWFDLSLICYSEKKRTIIRYIRQKMSFRQKRSRVFVQASKLAS